MRFPRLPEADRATTGIAVARRLISELAHELPRAASAMETPLSVGEVFTRSGVAYLMAPCT